MKALKDFKDERLSKQEMGNVIGGTWFYCYVRQGDVYTYSYHDFTSTQEMYDWIVKQLGLSENAEANCTKMNTFEGTFDDSIVIAQP